MAFVLRRLIAVVVAGAGVASLLATGPPPVPVVDLEVDHEIVCAGEPVTLSWSVDTAVSTPGPRDLWFVSAPEDGFDPALEGAFLSELTSPLTVTALRSTWLGVMNRDRYISGRALVGISAMLCDAFGRQWDDMALNVAAIDVDPISEELVIALQYPADESRLVTFDAALEPTSDMSIAGNVTALAITPSSRDRLVAGTTTTDLGEATPGQRSGFVRVIDTTGAVLWTDLFAAQATRGIALDINGDVVVVGTRGGYLEGTTAFVRRYDALGTLRWERLIDAGHGNSSGRAVQVAPDGTTAVTGVTGTLPNNTFLVTFDRDGGTDWDRRVAGHAASGALVFDGARWVLAANDVVAFEGDGSPAWTFVPPASSLPQALAVLPDGGLAVAYARYVEAPAPYHYAFGHLNVAVGRLSEAGIAISDEEFGSLGDDRAHTLAVWPALGPATLVVAGSTGSHLLAENTVRSLRNAFLIVLDD